jgi:TolB-like protein/DNA-binding winged helix-turn-helix (wHTH) protein/Tfp pilus assembly protein PilF
MDPLPSKPSLLTFGIFKVDLKACELRKAGIKQKLAPQPFQVLQALLERPGEIVAREQLRDLLWPDNTFVDYDLALKKAINRLREVLGDSADTPRYIETVPRQGYRFLAEVRGVDSPVPSRTEVARVHWKLAVGLSCAIAAALLFAFNVDRLRTRIFAKSRSLEIRSIAVLPLQNLSNDPNQDYFSDGITDALTTELAQIGALRVISRTSAEHFKGTRETLPEIARKLNVDAIVEGSVTRSENRVRITAQLIDARSDRHLWAETYERNLRDVLALQAEVSRDIATEVKVKLTPQEQARLSSARSIAPETYEAYLKGRYYYEKLSVAGFREALRYYQEALNSDSNYAPAYVALADAYTKLGIWNGLPSREAASKAKAAAERALALDDALGDAHATLGNIHFVWDWEWAAAEREYKRALDLGPLSTNARIQYAVYLSAMGRHYEAIAEMKEAHALDPVSHPTNLVLAFVYYLAHRFDEAIDQEKKTLALYPDSAPAHNTLGLCYEQKGMYPQAVGEYLKEKSLNGATKDELTTFRQAFARSGINGYLEATNPKSKRQYATPYSTGERYARVGDKGQAVEWLEKAYQERADHHMAFIKAEPMLDSLRSDPRFQDLLRRMGLLQ